MKHVIKTHRQWGKSRDLAMVDPNQMQAFFKELLNVKAPLEFKAFVAIALSSGARVSEVLELTKTCINSDGKFTIRVLKKRRQTIDRPCKLSPTAQAIVTEYLSLPRFDAQDKLFSFSRHKVLKQMQKHFGKHFCNHSLRHSFISWLLFSQGLEPLIVSKIMCIDLSIIERYAHINIAKEVDKLWAA